MGHTPPVERSFIRSLLFTTYNIRANDFQKTFRNASVCELGMREMYTIMFKQFIYCLYLCSPFPYILGNQQG